MYVLPVRLLPSIVLCNSHANNYINGSVHVLLCCTMIYKGRVSCNRFMRKHDPSYVTGFDKSRLGHTHQANSFSTANR